MKLKTLLFLLLFLPGTLYADQLFTGIRIWQGTWQPGQLAKAQDDAYRRTLKARLKGKQSLELIPLASNKASGLYGGPVLAYVTDDRAWSFGFVGLFGKSGKMGLTSQSATDANNLSTNVSNSFEFEPRRLDLDFSVAYALTSFIKVFAAVKHQDYEYKSYANLQGNFNGVLHPGQLTETSFSSRLLGRGKNKIRYSYDGPAGGLAFSIPVNDSSTLSISGAYFVASGLVEDLLWFGTTNFRSDELRYNEFYYNQLKTTIVLKGYTAEITYSTLASEKVLIQFGYRIQQSQIDLQYTWAEDNYVITQDGRQFSREPYPGAKFIDTFQGLTFSILYRYEDLL